MNFCPPYPGCTRVAVRRAEDEDERLVDRVEIRRKDLDRRLWIEDDRVAESHRADSGELGVEVAVRLDVNLYRLRPCPGEGFQVEVGTVHHQMDVPVEIRGDPARERDDVRTERQVGDERRIHDVDVQRIRARVFGAANPVGETSVVRREERWQNLNFHVGEIIPKIAAVRLLIVQPGFLPGVPSQSKFTCHDLVGDKVNVIKHVCVLRKKLHGFYP